MRTVTRYQSNDGVLWMTERDAQRRDELQRLWWRLMCVDITSGREYDQPYFVAHPNEARGLRSVAR